MRKFAFISVLFLLGILGISLGCREQARETKVEGTSYDLRDQDFYSGCPQYPAASKTLNLKSSLIEDQQIIKDSLNSKPCLMTMRVSEDFLRGYQDNLNGRKARLVNRTQEYVDGYNLAYEDIQNNVARRLEAIVTK